MHRTGIGDVGGWCRRDEVTRQKLSSILAEFFDAALTTKIVVASRMQHHPIGTRRHPHAAHGIAFTFDSVIAVP